MKKPVKLTPDQLAEVIAKRKPKFITVEKKIPAGTLATVSAAAHAFAEANEVDVTEVKFTNAYYNSIMKIRRLETDSEKDKRVRYEQDNLYRHKKYKYDRWVEQQAREMAHAAVLSKTNCCKCSCHCC